LNSTFVNVESLRDARASPYWKCMPKTPRRAPSSMVTWCACSTRVATTAASRRFPRARPGVVNGLGVWWRKLGLAGTNVNQLTSQKLTDMGAGTHFLRLRGRNRQGQPVLKQKHCDEIAL
jgi:hypothetical protein